jgi:WD40 repeat protein
VTPTRTATATPTFTPTWTPVPTRKSPFPVLLGTPVIDLGFLPIGIENVPQLRTIFTAVETRPYQAAVSADRQKLFLSTSAGLYLFDRQGQVLAYWNNIFTADLPCESCLSVNRDGSRFAVMTRNAGKWEAQVYDVQGQSLTLVFSLPVIPEFQGARNEASIAISPENKYLAFNAGASTLRVIDLDTKLQILGYNRQVDGIFFTPDGVNFVIHGGRELLFYNTSTWAHPANLLLPREHAPYSLSPDGKLLAIALPTKMRVYAVDKLQIVREINVPPSNADTREWQIDFQDNQVLKGYAVRWDTFHTTATVETGQWEVATGKTLNFETGESPSPNALPWLWGAALPLPANKSELETGDPGYNAFRFVSNEMVMVNNPHVVCWFKLLTGEETCFKDPAHVMFATDGDIYKEVVGETNTTLQDRAGKIVIEVGSYRFETVNRTGEWAVIESGKGTNLYQKGKKLPAEAVKGSLQGFAESPKLIVLNTLEQENTYYLTLIEKASGDAVAQIKANFLYPPVLMTTDGTVYYLQRDLGSNQTVLNYIEPGGHDGKEYTRLPKLAEPRVMTLSNTGLLAIGQMDGSVLVMAKDGGQLASFQAAPSPVEGVSFSPDGRFIAVASREGVRVFAILP